MNTTTTITKIARTLRYAILPGLLLISASMDAHRAKDGKRHRITEDKPEPALEISCQLFSAGKVLNDYYILMSADGAATDTLDVERSKPVFIALKTGHTYSLRFIKGGYAEKTVLVDTRLPKTQAVETLAPFDFDLELVPKEKAIGQSTFSDFPVAVVRYDKQRKELDYSKRYHNFIRKANAQERAMAANN